MEKEKKVKDVDFADSAVPSSARKNVVTMFMIMLGFTFFSASMWVGQQLADGLDFWGFLGSLILGGIILGIYTGLLGYVGAKTGLSLDLLSQRAFGEKGSYLPSAMTSFTQIGWFGVGLAMFAIPVSKELLGGSTAAQWGLVILAGVCMTASAYFGEEKTDGSPFRYHRNGCLRMAVLQLLRLAQHSELYPAAGRHDSGARLLHEQRGL